MGSARCLSCGPQRQAHFALAKFFIVGGRPTRWTYGTQVLDFAPVARSLARIGVGPRRVLTKPNGMRALAHTVLEFFRLVLVSGGAFATLPPLCH